MATATRTTLNFIPKNVNSGAQVEAMGKLEDVLGNLLLGMNVRLQDAVGNLIGNDFTDAGGNYSIIFTAPTIPGTHTYTLFFDGDVDYSPTSDDADLIVAGVPIPLIEVVTAVAAPIAVVTTIVVNEAVQRFVR